MVQRTFGTLGLIGFASAILRASRAAVVTSPILLPADSKTIGYTFSEGGVGSDGRTTFVATGITSNFLVEDLTYAIGPTDYAVVGMISGGTQVLTVSEGCAFAGGATAGAVGSCVKVLVQPTATIELTTVERLAPSSVFIVLNPAITTSASQTVTSTALTSSVGVGPSQSTRPPASSSTTAAPSFTPPTSSSERTTMAPATTAPTSSKNGASSAWASQGGGILQFGVVCMLFVLVVC